MGRITRIPKGQSDFTIIVLVAAGAAQAEDTLIARGDAPRALQLKA